MVDLLVKGKVIVTMNGNNDIIRDGMIAIDEKKILDVGPEKNIKQRYSADKTLEARDMIILPGLVNSHVHTVQTLFRGISDDVSLLSYLKQYMFPLEASLSKEDVYISALLGYAEMIKSGITTCADLQSVHHVDEAMKAAKEIGIRAKIAKVLMDSGDAPEELIQTKEEGIKDSLRLLRKWHGLDDGRIQFMFGPRFIHSCSLELMKEVRSLATQFKVGIHTHAAENKMEAKEDRRKYGKRTIEILHEVGLTAPDVLLAHCIWLSAKEFKILGETRSNVVHCPSCNMKLASGICDVSRLMKHGVTVSLGSDSASCNNVMDLFNEARLTAFLGKLRYLDPKVLPASKALEMATKNGAKALRLDHQIGSIEKGKKADIILLDFKKLHLVPVFDIISHLVYCCQGSDVNTVILDGKILMKNRKLMIDEEKVIKNAQRRAERLVNRLD